MKAGFSIFSWHKLCMMCGALAVIITMIWQGMGTVQFWLVAFAAGKSSPLLLLSIFFIANLIGLAGLTWSQRRESSTNIILKSHRPQSFSNDCFAAIARTEPSRPLYNKWQIRTSGSGLPLEKYLVYLLGEKVVEVPGLPFFLAISRTTSLFHRSFLPPAPLLVYLSKTNW